MHFYDYPFNPRGGIHNMNYSTRGRERGMEGLDCIFAGSYIFQLCNYN